MGRFMKRFIDLVVAAIALLMLAPVFAAVALAVRLSAGRPVLFRQVRAGYKGKSFTLLKFSTMTDARDAQGRLLPDAKRLTRVGKVLRRLSLDELPQLWNVLKGEMSLVGPRPLLVEYLDRYTREQARRHEVKPGITGWAQINGRNEPSWPEKFALDVWYVDHWNLLLDARILWRTARQVFCREGISQPRHATMPEFTGSEQSDL